MSPAVWIRVAVVVLLTTTAGCTYYRAITPPPPGKTAHLDTGSSELRVSQGIAVAFECVDGMGNPCEPRDAATDDSKIAAVHPAHSNELGPASAQGYDGPAPGQTFPPSTYVVVGVSPGETLLQIGDEEPLRIVVEQ